MRFVNLSISAKALVGIVILGAVSLVALLLLAGTTYRTIHTFEQFRDGTSTGALSLARSKTFLAIRSRMVMQIIVEPNPAAKAKLQGELGNVDERFLELFGAARTVLTPFHRDLNAIAVTFDDLQRKGDRLIVRQGENGGNVDAAVMQEFRSYIAATDDMDARITAIVGTVLQNEEMGYTAMTSHADQRVIGVVAITTLLLLASAFGLHLMLRRTVSGPLEVLSETARDLLAGNLDRPVPAADRRDEVGRLAVAVERLKQSLIASGHLKRQTLDSAQQVASATGQAAVAIEQVSDGAHRQMRSVTGIATSLGETTDLIGSIADMSGEAKVSAQSATAMVMSSMENIQALTVAVREIAVTSEQINRITASIGQLATRSNILSLNAAIEAARAGDHGRGFSVVAEEVGSLAQQTANLAQEISSLAASTADRIRNGVGIAESVGTLMQDAVVAVGRTDSLSAEIARAVDEQRRKLADVEVALRALQDISSATAAAGEEISATMVELTRMANRSREQADKVGMPGA
ncbi:MAG: hypothetical protein RLY86_1651 [Pseudomonadota bacterium]|jgi:methyl-accepting chemotaxis protein